MQQYFSIKVLSVYSLFFYVIVITFCNSRQIDDVNAQYLMRNEKYGVKY